MSTKQEIRESETWVLGMDDFLLERIPALQDPAEAQQTTEGLSESIKGRDPASEREKIELNSFKRIEG